MPLLCAEHANYRVWQALATTKKSYHPFTHETCGTVINIGKFQCHAPLGPRFSLLPLANMTDIHEGFNHSCPLPRPDSLSTTFFIFWDITAYLYHTCVFRIEESSSTPSANSVYTSDIWYLFIHFVHIPYRGTS